MAPPRDTEFLRRLREAQHLFHGEWTTAILLVLSDGPKHYTEIRDAVRSLNARAYQLGRHHVLHDSVLTRTLKTLAARKLIEREQMPGRFPPSVRYALNPAAAQALTAWEPVADWAREHSNLINCAELQRHDGGAEHGPSSASALELADLREGLSDRDHEQTAH